MAIGDAVILRVVVPDARCVMTTLAQDELPKDTDILRALAKYNRIQIGDSQSACIGVYAVVEAPGMIRSSDAVTLL